MMRKARLLRAGVTTALVVAVAGGVSGTARAGTYKVKYDNTSNGQGCALFSATATPGYLASCTASALMIQQNPLSDVPGGSEENLSVHAPAGLTITDATSTYATTDAGSGGWGAGDFYTGGGNSWNPGANMGLNASPLSDPGFSSSSWGFQLLCSAQVAQCARPAQGTNPPSLGPPAAVAVTSVVFTVGESKAPSITPAGAHNLLNQTSGYVWNPAGNPWSVATAVADPSGVCGLVPAVNGTTLSAIPINAPNAYAWRQCPDTTYPDFLDTRQYVPTAGPLALSMTATNQGSVSTSISPTIHVDNDPVSVALATPNDPNPTLWVNHAVNVQSSASAGPSGISATGCSIDGAASFAYPAGGFLVDGDGVHTVSCTAANGAVGPQGQHNTGSATQTVKIDEAPPAIGFAPVNPDVPTAVVVDASDAESGVAGGSITVQSPHGKPPRALKSALESGNLVSRFDDAGKHGVYTFVASACDAVGNCASTSEALRFPIRLGTRGLISFHTIRVPAVRITKTLRVGGHHRTVERREKIHGKVRRVKRTITVGAHRRRVRVHVRRGRRCGHKMIHVHVRGHRRRRRVVACRKLRYRIATRHRQHLGRKVKVYGLLRTRQGRPLAHARVVIRTRPEDRGGRFHRATATTTDAHGRWQVKLPGGPSRTIRARYPGTVITEPATSTAHLTVPAAIRLHISPHVLPWSHAIRIRGHLVGRFVPHDGVALRLLVRYPHAQQRTALQALRTNRHGAFSFSWNYHSGRGVATYPFSVATTATETDYPYAAGVSRPVRITFGRRTPHHRHGHHHRHHRGRHRHHRHRHHQHHRHRHHSHSR